MSTDAPTTLIAAQELGVRYNDQVVLSGATLAVAEGRRIGMVGRNGCGKSTFLKILTGIQDPDEGSVVRRTGMRFGYLPQNFTLDPARTVYENIREGGRAVLDLIGRFEALPGDSPEHERLERQIMLADGWNLDTRIETLMDHLNTPPGESGLEKLSGGELRRVALCRALVDRPDLLVLDEPTNHLDAESIGWLAEFLKSFGGACLVVTHDRYFLDEVATSIVELDEGRFFTYEGNYTDFLTAQSERKAIDDSIERKRQAFIRRELDWIRRGPKARTTKAKSRVDRFDDAVGQAGPAEAIDMDLVIPPPPPMGNRIVDLINVGIRLGGRKLISGFDFNFQRGMKIGVTGRNGLGKTTLVRLILNQLQPGEGTVKAGAQVQFNYVDQSRLMLHEENTLLQEVGEGAEYILFGNGKVSVRAYLKRFLFPDSRLGMKVKSLSGGERSRLLLARILKRGGNFLIFDEPTNDLDLPTLRVMEEALLAFKGCVLVVSHDRYFLNRICTGILAFEGRGQIHYSPGDFDYYLDKKRERIQAERGYAAAKAKRAGTGGKQGSGGNKPRKLTWKERRELEGMEERILEAESEIQRIEGIFASPAFHQTHGSKTPELQQELEKKKSEVAALYERWEELERIDQEAEAGKG